MIRQETIESIESDPIESVMIDCPCAGMPGFMARPEKLQFHPDLPRSGPVRAGEEDRR